MFNNKFFQIAFGILLVLLIIFLASQVPYIMEPISSVLSLLILPILLGGFLYYLLRPLVRFFAERLSSRSFAIIFSIFLVISFLALIFYFGGSIIFNEIRELTKYYSINYELIIKNLNKLKNFDNVNLDFLQEFNIQERIINFANELLSRLTRYNYTGAFSSITNFGMIIILIPFVLYYLLKDDEKTYQKILNIFPEDKQERADKIGHEIDQVLATFIGSQLLVALILGIYMFAAFLIIGLPNALALALIAMVLSLIPMLGPILGILPALFVALTKTYALVIGVLVVLATAQYLEGNWIRPLVQGKSLEIHPLIVIFIVLIAVYLFGFLGALFAVPIYVVLRILVKNLVIEK